MKSIHWMIVLCGVFVIGCAHDSGDKFREAEPGMQRDPVGYFEYKDHGAVYVLGSIQSLEALQAGKQVKTMTAGFSASGQPVYFETDDRGLAQRLIGQYEQRHGMSR